MTLQLDEAQTRAILEGGWEAEWVRTDVADDLYVRHLREPVAVLLGANLGVAFWVVDGEVL